MFSLHFFLFENSYFLFLNVTYVGVIILLFFLTDAPAAHGISGARVWKLQAHTTATAMLDPMASAT